jgi:hypothetical protein
MDNFTFTFYQFNITPALDEGGVDSGTYLIWRAMLHMV